MKLSLSLLVLRCKNVDVTRRFYEHLGIVFTKEKHQKGPEHYSWKNSGFVLELYPTAEDPIPDQVRLGFSTALLADISGNVRDSAEITVIKQPYATSDRLIMVLQDPDGRKVELSQALHR